MSAVSTPPNNCVNVGTDALVCPKNKAVGADRRGRLSLQDPRES